MIKLKDILEGTCGYGIDGKLGDEPAGSHLLKKKKKKNESVGSKKYNGRDWFWPHDYRHYLRDASPAQRKKIHDAWLKIGVPVKGTGLKISDRYLEPKKNQLKKAWTIVRKVVAPKELGMPIPESTDKEIKLKEAKKKDDPCWAGYTQYGMKDKDGKKVPNCVKETTEIFYEVDGKGHGYTFEYIRTKDLNEAEYQGRKVKLGKPMQGDTKKFKVYVKNPKGNVVKVNFGQGGGAKGGTMRIRKSNPEARKSFRARHNCDNPGPRHKARYWSCRKW